MRNEIVTVGYHQTGRFLLRITDQIDHSCQTIDMIAEPGVIRRRPGQSLIGVTYHDDTGIDFLKVFVAESPALHHTRTVTVSHDICPRCQFFSDFQPARCF